MASKCFYTGKKISKGNKITTRGKPKYLGGNGTKVTGITRRKFKPNLQKVKVVVDGKPVRVKASAKAIRMGLVTKPQVKKPFEVKPF